jgi:hypothetical protein
MKPLRYITKMYFDRYGDIVPVLLFPENNYPDEDNRKNWVLEAWCATSPGEKGTVYGPHCLEWENAPADEERKVLRQFRKSDEVYETVPMESWKQIIKKIVKADKTAKFLLDEPEFFEGKVIFSCDNRAVWVGAHGGHERGFLLIGNKIEWFDVDGSRWNMSHRQ